MTDVSRKDQLLKLVMQIVPSQMKHHAEAEACDLLMEVEKLNVLKDFVDQVGNNCPKVYQIWKNVIERNKNRLCSFDRNISRI